MQLTKSNKIEQNSLQKFLLNVLLITTISLKIYDTHQIKKKKKEVSYFFLSNKLKNISIKTDWLLLLSKDYIHNSYIKIVVTRKIYLRSMYILVENIFF